MGDRAYASITTKGAGARIIVAVPRIDVTGVHDGDARSLAQQRRLAL